MLETQLESNSFSKKNDDEITRKELDESFEDSTDDGISWDSLSESFETWIVDVKNSVIEGLLIVLPVSVIQILADNHLLDNIDRTDPQALSVISIEKWQQINVSQIPAESIAELPEVFVANMSTIQLSDLRSDQIKLLTPIQVEVLSPEQLSSIGENITNLSDASIKALSSEQLQGLAESENLKYINPDKINEQSLKGWDDYSVLPPNYISQIPVEEFKTIDISHFTPEQLDACTKEQLAMMPYERAQTQIEKVLPQKIDWEAIKNDALESGAWGAGFGTLFGPEVTIGGGAAGLIVGAIGEGIRQELVMHGGDEDVAQGVETAINFVVPAGGGKMLLKEGGEQLLKHGDEVVKVAKDKVEDVVESEVKSSLENTLQKELPELSEAQLKHVKGEISEGMMDKYFTNSGWKKIEGEVGRNGIDGLYVRGDHGHLKVLFSESKYNTSQLGETLHGKQMSQQWLEKKIDDLIKANPNNIEYKEISELIQKGEYRSRLWQLKDEGQKLGIEVSDIEQIGKQGIAIKDIPGKENLKINSPMYKEIDLQNPADVYAKKIAEQYNDTVSKVINSRKNSLDSTV